MRIVNHHRRILVEADVGSVAAAMLLAGADDNRLHNLALLDGAVGRSFFYSGSDDIAETGNLAQSTTERQDHLQLARAGVIGHREHGSHLHSHGFFSLKPLRLL